MSYDKPKHKILTAGPSISELERDYVLDAVMNGWNENWNAYLKRFEQTFAEYIGVRYAVSTSSCTGALHLALLALDIGTGDEVILPDITWVATAAAVTYCGAEPVFADVEPDTLCISPASIRKRLTPKTKAVMPVHNYGNLSDMDEIAEIAEAHNLNIIEDAAPSLGATYKGRRTGSLGHAAAFSFQGAKIMTCGEGGMLVTDDRALFERALKLGDHGRSETRALWNDEIGYKYKMSNIQAALGLAQLERIDSFVEAKRQIHRRYIEGLGDIEGLQLNIERPGCKSNFWMPTMIMKRDFGIERDRVIERLREMNVDSRPVFYPLSSFPMFETCPDNEVAYRVSRTGINLPGGVLLSAEEIGYVCECIRTVLLG